MLQKRIAGAGLRYTSYVERRAQLRGMTAQSAASFQSHVRRILLCNSLKLFLLKLSRNREK